MRFTIVIVSICVILVSIFVILERNKNTNAEIIAVNDTPVRIGTKEL